jgi:hypothetical protein
MPSIKPRAVVAYCDASRSACPINWRYRGVATEQHPSGGAWWIDWETDATTANEFGRSELVNGWYSERVLAATGARA